MPVGFRVESFDMQFIQSHMPLTMQVLLGDTHAQDLNAMIRMTAAYAGIDFQKLKDRLKEIVAEKIVNVPVYGSEPAGAHNAFYDASEAWYIWELFMSGGVKKIQVKDLK